MSSLVPSFVWFVRSLRALAARASAQMSPTDARLRLASPDRTQQRHPVEPADVVADGRVRSRYGPVECSACSDTEVPIRSLGSMLPQARTSTPLTGARGDVF